MSMGRDIEIYKMNKENRTVINTRRKKPYVFWILG
jgi:hypothetical protein